MKKVLILSVHFPPDNIIAARRAEAYANYLHRHGIAPTIVTHRWERTGERLDENGWVVHEHGEKSLIEEMDNYTVIRVPRKETRKGQLMRQRASNKWTNRFQIFRNWFNGDLDAISSAIDSYTNINEFLFEYLKTHKYDLLIGIFSPHHHIRSCYDLNRRFGIPYMIDFRDLWTNEVLQRTYTPRVTQKIRDYFIKKHWRKWLSNAIRFTAVSGPIRDIIDEFVQPKGAIVTNGYESDLFNNVTKRKNESFTIAHIGTLYDGQRLDLIFEALSTLKQNKRIGSFCLHFVGVKKSMKKRINDTAEKYKLTDSIVMTERVPREKAIEIMVSSNILFYPAWENERGIYSGKIFEYLGSKTPVLVTPSDQDVVEELINKTQAGVCSNSLDEVKAFIKDNYEKWEKGEAGANKSKLVEMYTREAQVAEMASIIQQNL
ncbi:glycosyltransferase [Fulvivirgaceae bacterium BMA10]|uniref:Glycosyltransferase n=1 Tax=Splendidivirga corallicola TaxID=3051826 RepID=A0ABT8KY05_9BACT|nr:glycosyltransferase [Fulvivirgaceae bacterium BMA10]